MSNVIEAMVASPPERDELVIQFFVKDGGQWGELFRGENGFTLEVFTDGVLALDACEMTNAISKGIEELKARLE